MLRTLALAAATATVASAAGLRRQLAPAGGSFPVAPVDNAVTVLYAIPGPAAFTTLLTASAAEGEFTTALTALAGGSGQVAVSVAAWQPCDVSAANSWLDCAVAPVYATAVLRDSSYAPRAATYLERNYKDAALVNASFADFLLSVGSDVAPVPVAMDARVAAWNKPWSKYDSDFGAYFGVGLGACAGLLAFIGYRRFAAAPAVAAAPAPAVAAPTVA